MNRLNYNRILTILFLGSVFLLALSKISVIDAWVHLSAGRIIWEGKSLPINEPFAYANIGHPFLYTNWLFGLIFYIAYYTFNIYGVIILKAIIVTIAFYILLIDALRPYNNYVLTIIVMTFILLVVRHRFVERPDIVLMIFLSFSIFSLNVFIYENKRYIYALPLIHMFWANSHSSINLMFIPFLSFLVGGLTQQYLTQKGMTFSNTPSRSQLKIITLVLIASFITSLISPYFITQYTFGTQVLTSNYFKQELLELKAPTWATEKSPYLVTIAIIISFVFNLFIAYSSRVTDLRKEYPSFIHFLIIMPFIVLAFTAYRFIFLLSIVAGPIIVRNISVSVNLKQWNGLFVNKILPVAVSLWIFLYLILAVMMVEPFGSRLQKFGFGVDYEFTPEHALAYMDKKGITGRIFNSLNIGGYITWRDFPTRSVFTDTKEVRADLVEKMSLALRKASVLDELYITYGFESVLIEYPNVNADISGIGVDIALSNPQWALVYWDDQSLLYLKRGGKYDHIINEDEYQFVKPASGINKLELTNKDYRSNMIKELKRNIEETGSSRAYVLIGSIYNNLGLYREAIDSYSNAKESYLYDPTATAYSGMAYAYSMLGDRDSSLKYYKKVISVKEDAAAYYNIGTIYSEKGNNKVALNYLEKALNMNSNLTYIYPLLIDTYRKLGRENEVRKLKQQYESASVTAIAQLHFKNGVKAYLEQRYDVAIEEFKKTIEVNPSSAMAYSNLGFAYFEAGMIDKSFESQAKAIDIAPNLASANYGLAEIYKKRGDLKMAKRYYEEYLRLEPSGFHSRRAKEEIQALK